jgi:FXSXX-COOH protein
MLTAEELRPASPSVMVDLDEVPLTEMLALGPEVIHRAIGRALPGGAAVTGPAAGAFQSAP